MSTPSELRGLTIGASLVIVRTTEGPDLRNTIDPVLANARAFSVGMVVEFRGMTGTLVIVRRADGLDQAVLDSDVALFTPDDVALLESSP